MELNDDRRRLGSAHIEQGAWHTPERCAFFSHVFARHVVGLYVVCADGTPIQKEVWTGFLFVERGLAIWITAGHVIDRIEHLKRLPSDTFVGGQWLDHCPIPHAECVPADLRSMRTAKVDDEGFDIGCVGIDPFCVRTLLGESSELDPLNRMIWTGRSKAVPEAYYLVGFPTEWVRCETIMRPGGVDERVEAVTAVIPLEPVSPDVEQRPSTFWGCPNSFYAEALPCKDDNGQLLKSLKGTSGGPIFGVARAKHGGFHYWLYGVQSHWLPDKRIIRATKIDVLESTVDGLIGDRTKQHA